MSANPRPRRRPSPAVYRRRRLVVLVVVVLVVVGAVRLLTGGDDPAPTAAEPAAPTSSAPSAAASVEPTAEPTRKVRTRRMVDVDVDLSSSGGACAADAVGVQPAVPGGAYTDGPVAVRLALTTTSTRACTLDLADVDLIVDVANEDGVSLWSTQVCPDAVPRRSVQLDPTWSTSVDLTWSGRRGGDDCADTERFLPAKTYEVRAAVLGGEPGTAEAVLRTRPKPKPSPKPSPTPSATPSSAAPTTPAASD